MIVAVIIAAVVAGDCFNPPQVDVFPFAGRTVPLNAELRCAGAPASFVLRGPEGQEEELQASTNLSIVTPSTHALAPTILSEGAWTLTRGDDGLVVNFDVEDVVDDEAPAAPTVTASSATKGSLYNPLSCENCGAIWPTDFVTVTVDSEDDAAFFDVVGRLDAPLKSSSGGTSFVEKQGGAVAYDVRVFDFAGNVSDTTQATAWTGCEGGCASSSSLPLAATLLLLLRRRR